MTATPSGAVYLVEGVIRSSFLPLRRAFWVRSGIGGASGVTSSFEALPSALCQLWGHLAPTLSTLSKRRGS